MVPSALAFHRVTTPMIATYPEILNAELTQRFAGEPDFRLTAQPYALREGTGLPRLDDLTALARLLDQKAYRAGHARNLLTLLALHRAEARKRYGRWRENLESARRENQKRRGDGNDFLKEFDTHLGKALVAPLDQTLPAALIDGHMVTPLGDVMALLAVKGIDRD